MAKKVEANSPQHAKLDVWAKKKLDEWTKKLKSAFYDVEDILEAIDYHRLKSEAVYRSAKSTKQVRSSLSPFMKKIYS